MNSTARQELIDSALRLLILRGVAAANALLAWSTHLVDRGFCLDLHPEERATLLGQADAREGAKG